MCENMKRGVRTIGLSLLASTLLLAGCAKGTPTEPATPTPAEPTAGPVSANDFLDAFPGADAVQGWTPNGEVETFDSETIFNLVNGQADFFFVYGFELVAVRSYENLDGVVLDIQIWQLADHAGAYGLFTAGIAGEPLDIGNEGDGDPGRRLSFWQDRYVVQMFARKAIPDADLQALAKAISAALPAGGEQPALMDRLPSEGLVERGALFFHEELSIQSEIWLGGTNLLGLSQETDGVLARYDLGSATARLLLVQYPEADEASAALTALEDSQVDRLVTAKARDRLLGAVFGEVDSAAATTLLTKALQ
jgi:hypothetical protein